MLCCIIQVTNTRKLTGMNYYIGPYRALIASGLLNYCFLNAVENCARKRRSSIRRRLEMRCLLNKAEGHWSHGSRRGRGLSSAVRGVQKEIG